MCGALTWAPCDNRWYNPSRVVTACGVARWIGFNKASLYVWTHTFQLWNSIVYIPVESVRWGNLPRPGRCVLKRDICRKLDRPNTILLCVRFGIIKNTDGWWTWKPPFSVYTVRIPNNAAVSLQHSRRQASLISTCVCSLLFTNCKNGFKFQNIQYKYSYVYC